MATPVLAQFFDGLLRQIEIDATLTAQIVEVHRRISRVVQATWRGAALFYSGSYGRKTKIQPLQDVDLFLVRDEAYKEIVAIPHQPDALLQELERALVEEPVLRGGPLRRQRRSLGLHQSGWRIDLVPALRRKDGGYYIMDREKRDGRPWIFTDPRKHAEFTKERNAAIQNMGVPLVKLIKCWRNCQGIRLRSFHVEVMVLRALMERPGSYAEGIAQLFARLASAVLKPCGDPGGSGGRIDDYLTLEDRTRAAQRLREAQAEMDAALLGLRSDPSASVRRVRALFKEDG